MSKYSTYEHNEMPYIIKLLNSGDKSFFVKHEGVHIHKNGNFCFESIVLDDLSECGRYFHFNGELCRVPTKQEMEMLIDESKSEPICGYSRFNINIVEKLGVENNEHNGILHHSPKMFSVEGDVIPQLTSEGVMANIAAINGFIQFETMAEVLAFTKCLELQNERYFVKPRGLFFNSEGKLEFDLPGEMQNFYGKEDYFCYSGRLHRKPTKRESQILEEHATNHEMIGLFDVAFGENFKKYFDLDDEGGLSIRHLLLLDEQRIPEVTEEAIIEDLQNNGFLKHA